MPPARAPASRRWPRPTSRPATATPAEAAAGGRRRRRDGLGWRRRRGLGRRRRRCRFAHRRIGRGRGRRLRPRARGHRQRGGRKQERARKLANRATSSLFNMRSQLRYMLGATDTSTAVADEPNPSVSETPPADKGLADILVESFRLYRAHARPMLLICALLFVPASLAKSCVMSALLTPKLAAGSPAKVAELARDAEAAGSALADAYARNADADTIARLQRENQQRLGGDRPRRRRAGPVHALGAGRARHAGVRAGVRHRGAVDGRRADHRRRRQGDRRPHRMGRSLDAAARAAGPAAGGDRPGRRLDRDRPACCG